MAAEILIENPTHPYAVRFIEEFHSRFGMKSVIFFTDAEDMRRAAPRFPVLKSDMIAASYLVDADDLGSLVPTLESDHDIALILPFYEPSLLDVASLSRQMGISAVDPDVLARFRDKFELKQFLVRQMNPPRLNATVLVRSVDEVEQECERGGYSKFVLKPNEGYANRRVVTFDSSAPRELLEAYIANSGGNPILMEEYIDGVEYSVKGQVDALGNTLIFGIHQKTRISLNGRTNLVSQVRRVRHSDPIFTWLSDYASDVLAKSQLTRSPFHMDVIVDDRGPCLVEVGARMSGEGNSFELNELHGGEFDVFAIAAHYYLETSDFGPLHLDWDNYDSLEMTNVYGFATIRQRIYELDGIAEAEAIPEFVRWKIKPHVGDRVVPTQDLDSNPWVVTLVSKDPTAIDAAALKLRNLITWNDEEVTTRRTGLVVRSYGSVAKRLWRSRPRPNWLRPRRIQPSDSIEPSISTDHAPGGQVLIENPTHSYATRFIDLYHREYGLKTVAYYTDPADMKRAVARFPILRSSAIAASYTVSPEYLEHMIPVLRDKHNIVAVVPYYEPTVAPARLLGSAVGVEWVQPEVLARFRDKASQKEFLRSIPNGPRVNNSCLVANPDEVVQAIESGGYQKFVLKPNSGYGNAAIGFFDTETDRASIDRYFDETTDSVIVMEEFIAGDEYCVVGMINGKQDVLVLAVYSTPYVAANGRDNLVSGFHQVHRNDPRYEVLASYSQEVISATGLSRSPFHVDLKMDDTGPCVIEMGARFAGDGNAFDLNQIYNHTIDVFDVAAHYYLTDEEYGSLDIDWDAYDRRAYRVLYGISTERERIYEIQGIEEIEALPEFVRWRLKPEIGMRVEKTTDLATKPWQLTIAGESEERLDEVEAFVRQTLRWNQRDDSSAISAKKIKANLAIVARRWRTRPRPFMLRPTKID